MAADLERLVVSLEANIRKFEKEIARSRAVTVAALGDVERTIDKSTERVEANMGRFGASIRAGLASALAGVSIAGLKEFADANTRIENALKVAGLEGKDLSKVYDELYDTAQRQGVPFEALATLYGRAAQAQKELGVSSAELTRFTEGVAVALRVSGTSTEQASGALLQLGQLLSAGKVQAEEFNSVQEGALPVLQAVANGLIEAGGSVARLKQLVNDGEVSSKAFFRAFEAGRPSIDKLAQSTAPTLSQGMERLRNALTRVVGQIDKMAGATAALGDAMQVVVNLVGKLPEALQQDIKDLRKIAEIVNSIADAIHRAAGTTALVAPVLRQEAERDPNDPAPLAIRVKPKARRTELPDDDVTGPVSTKDFPNAGKAKGAGGGGGSKDRVNDFEKETAAIEKRTRALDDERSVVGASTFEVARSEAALKLEEAAKKANIETTEGLQIKINDLASAYATAKVKLDEAEERQRRFEEASRQTGATLSDAFGDAIVNGQKLITIMDRLLKSLATRGIDSVFDTLFGKGGAGTNFLGSLVSGIGGGSAPGRAGGGPVVAGRPYTVGERGPERFIPTTPGRIVSARNSRGAGPDIRMGDIVINAPGADATALARLHGYVDASLRESRRTIGQQLAAWKLDN